MAHLTLDQRYEIEVYGKTGKSILEIADYIGKDRSSIYKEIKRNSDQRSGIYKGILADKKAKNRHTLKPKSCKFNATVEPAYWII
jgi:IS30 family transposase